MLAELAGFDFWNNYPTKRKLYYKNPIFALPLFTPKTGNSAKTTGRKRLAISL